MNFTRRWRYKCVHIGLGVASGVTFQFPLMWKTRHEIRFRRNSAIVDGRFRDNGFSSRSRVFIINIYVWKSNNDHIDMLGQIHTKENRIIPTEWIRTFFFSFLYAYTCVWFSEEKINTNSILVSYTCTLAIVIPTWGWKVHSAKNGDNYICFSIFYSLHRSIDEPWNRVHRR